jgi:hypothetical protein
MLLWDFFSPLACLMYAKMRSALEDRLYLEKGWAVQVRGHSDVLRDHTGSGAVIAGT